MRGKKILIAGGDGSCGLFLYMSKAVVYGKHRYSPINEDYSLIVEKPRKPLNGVEKTAADSVSYVLEGA